MYEYQKWVLEECRPVCNILAGELRYLWIRFLAFFKNISSYFYFIISAEWMSYSFEPSFLRQSLVKIHPSLKNKFFKRKWIPLTMVRACVLRSDESRFVLPTENFDDPIFTMKKSKVNYNDQPVSTTGKVINSPVVCQCLVRMHHFNKMASFLSTRQDDHCIFPHPCCRLSSNCLVILYLHRQKHTSYSLVFQH